MLPRSPSSMVIGQDPWTGEGWTAKRVAGVLRTIGQRDVTVAINSPGGDVFEGVSIYNLLREHQAKVTVKVLGLAASAASIIAMAGDENLMGNGAMMMVHNSWGLVVGNRHDMTDAAGMLEAVDGSMAEIYAARTGQPKKAMAAMMDAETWLSAQQAIDGGFAEDMTEDAPPPAAHARADLQAKHQIDTILARQGMPRSERRRLLRDLTSSGTHDAVAASATRDAGLSAVADDLRRLLATLS